MARGADWRRLLLALLTFLLLIVGAACSSAPTFDRSQAVERVMARGGTGITRRQAECYVDKVIAEVGSAALETDDPDPEKIAKLTRLRIDCVGLASLGTNPPGSVTVTTVTDPGIAVPRSPGDDPQLDQLHAACGAGNGTACDQLFDLAALGSAYEEFAGTCGGRTREIRCAPLYPGPSIVLPTTSATSSAVGANTITSAPPVRSTRP